MRLKRTSLPVRHQQTATSRIGWFTNRFLALSPAVLIFAAFSAFNSGAAAAATTDPVVEWIGVMNDTVISGATSALITTRVAALVSASVFDAVNGIEPQYRPPYMRPNAQHPASQRAAAIQAAYAILLKVYPSQSGNLTTHRNASLAALNEKVFSNCNGIAWGQSVADAVWNLRLTDGNAPPPRPSWVQTSWASGVQRL